MKEAKAVETEHDWVSTLAFDEMWKSELPPKAK
jgi:hypothetical protein